MNARLASMRRLVVVILAIAGASLLSFAAEQEPAFTSLAATPPSSSVQSVSNKVILVAAPQVLYFGDASAPGMTYNGDYAGPLLRVKPGGILSVHLVNHLQRDTNLHFHGILTSPLGRSDNMMVHVAPGQSFDYEVKVPRYQTPGLYWYHTHIHGEAYKDVNAGLSGPLLVEGSVVPFERAAPGVEQVMVLKEYEVDRESKADFPNELRRRILTINGSINTMLNLRPGEHQLWHIGNLGPNRPFQLSIAGHQLTIVGHDGAPSLHPVTVDTLDVDPGSRYDVLFDAGGAGDFSIRGAADDGDGRGRGGCQRGRTHRDQREDNNDTEGVLLGTLRVSGTPLTPSPMPASILSPAQDLTYSHIDAHCLIVFGEEGRDYTINGKTFDPMRVDTRVPLGSIEEWTIRNDSNDMHVFHIHQVNFQVMSVNGQPQSFNGAVDTVRVLPRAPVVIRIAFTHPEIVGRFMYHCHVLQHEDRGMMAQIEVYDSRHPSAESGSVMPSMALPSQ